ncbi:MAG: RICIN domain-containing protein [Candidatus Binatia bacterium]
MPVPDSDCVIKNVFSKKVLGITGSGQVRQSADKGAPYQVWKLTHEGADSNGDYYKIVNRQGIDEELALDVQNAARTNETPVLQWPYRGAPHQQWYLRPVDEANSTYQIVARHSDKAMDLARWDGADTATIEQFDASWPPGANQQWQLTLSRTIPDEHTRPKHDEHTTITTKTRLEKGIYTWGYNLEGYLGDGSATNRSTPARIPYLTDEAEKGLIKAVAAGGFHGLALLESGRVYTWGSQDWYQLGNNKWEDSPIPIAVTELPDRKRNPVTAIAAGGWYSLALLSDGTVYAWGANDWGQLGRGATTGQVYNAPAKVQGLPDSQRNPVTAMDAGGWINLALLKDGTVYFWGAGDWYQNGSNQSLAAWTSAVRMPGLPDPQENPVTAIAAGGWHSLVLLKDGTVYAWGANNFGQLGRGSTDAVPTYTPPQEVQGLPDPGEDPVTGIAAGGRFCLAVVRSGAVYAWGQNSYGQLGRGDTADSHQAVEVRLEGVKIKSVAASKNPFDWYFSLALVQGDNSVRGWGYNYTGQLGHGDSANHHYLPVVVEGLEGIRAISAGGSFGIALV